MVTAARQSCQLRRNARVDRVRADGRGGGEGRTAASSKQQKKDNNKPQADGGEDEGEGEEGGSEEDKGLLTKLRDSISKVMKGADLESMTVKKVREALTIEHGQEMVDKFRDRIKHYVRVAADAMQTDE